MSINNALNYLLNQRHECLFAFSAPVTTLSTYLNGPGGVAGDGFPMAGAARIYRIDCWDGSNLVSGTENIKFSQGERLSVYATASGLNFNVSVRKNGIDTLLVANGTAQNCSLYVTVHLKLL